MYKLIPVVEITIEEKGRLHNLQKALDDIYKLDTTVIVVNQGTLKYCSSLSFQAAMCKTIKNAHKHASVIIIPGEETRLLIIKR